MKKFFLIAAACALLAGCADSTSSNWIIENNSPAKVDVKIDGSKYTLNQGELKVIPNDSEEPVISLDASKYGFTGSLKYTTGFYYAEGKSYRKLNIQEREKLVYEITNMNPADILDETVNQVYYTDGITIDETTIGKIENYNGDEFNTYKYKVFTVKAGETVTRTFYTDYLYGRTPEFKFYVDEGAVTTTKSYDKETGAYKILIPVQLP